MTEASTFQAADVSHEEDFPHTPAVVWRALTEQALLARWVMKNDFLPQKGRAFTFRMDVPPSPQWDGVVKGEVLEIEPERRLVFSWASGGVDTRVTWTLTPVDGGTRLKIVQSGFELPAHQQAYQGATYGWRRNFGELRTVLDGLEA